MHHIRRKVRDAAHARELLAELRRTPLTLAEFARQRGIDGRSLNMHRVNLGLEGAEAGVRGPVRLVELVPEPHERECAVDQVGRYVVRCGDLAIEVDDQFDETVLRRLLAVVVSC